MLDVDYDFVDTGSRMTVVSVVTSGLTEKSWCFFSRKGKRFLFTPNPYAGYWGWGSFLFSVPWSKAPGHEAGLSPPWFRS